ncbi:MAG: anthranilate synthase component I [Candidatus Glassbacteria bacterium]|nr:anthranilate synthase component I [Candidatus Glassbacteria bacterium]
MTKIRPAEEMFLEVARPGTIVPVVAELYTDTETPISVFKKLCEPNDYAFLLESVEMEEKIGRYSFLGLATCTVIRARGDRIEQVTDGELTVSRGNPVEYLKEYIGRYKPVPLPGLPPFQCGVVGYFSYDTIRYFEDIPCTKPDPLQLPDCYLMVADQMIVFDHIKHTLTVIKNAFIEEGDDPVQEYRRACEKVEWLVRRINEIVLVPQNIGSRTGSELPEISSNTTREEYERMVVRAKEYIHAGDIFQVVLSHRLSTRLSCDPFDLYRALRRVNPSPYMFYLKFGDLKVAGSSPEVLVRVQDGVVTSRPLAGTRPRGADEAEDQRLEQELLADPKERAEHVMLVDLGRNDLGRVCEYGSVRVTEQMKIERYSHVMHIVSNVEGDMRKGVNALDVLGACFPAGTVSGAPKVRAMEIIDELEKEERGIYAGAAGYIDFSGNLDTCIAIRTIVIKDNVAYIQAGAGIVADSDPASEYQETINKATALLKAVEQSGEFL